MRAPGSRARGLAAEVPRRHCVPKVRGIEPHYTTAQVARALSVNPETVRRLAARRKLRFVRGGAELRFAESAVRGYLDRQTGQRRLHLAPQSVGFSAQRRGRRRWAHLGSNQGPPACEAGALPLSYAPRAGAGYRARGLGRLEGESLPRGPGGP